MADLTPFTFIIWALADYRITRFFLQDELFRPLRERIWARFPPESTKIGYLFTCPWCISLWVSAFCVIAVCFAGIIGLAVALIFALSAVVGITQTLLER